MVFFQRVPIFDAKCPTLPDCPFGTQCLFSHQSDKDGLPTDHLLNRLAKRSLPATKGKETNPKSSPPPPVERPKLKLSPNMKFSWQLRQSFLDKFFDILLPHHPEPLKQAFREEAAIYHQCKHASVYRSVGLARLKSLKAEMEEMSLRKDNERSPLPLDVTMLETLLLSQEIMSELGFPSEAYEPATIPPEVNCVRCRKPFNPSLDCGDDPCRFHHGRLFRPNRHERVYSCCHGKDMSTPCCTEERHVFVMERQYGGAGGLFSLGDRDLTIVAMDGEMVHTERGMELARLSMVDWELNTLLDEWIKPAHPIIDYNTRYSGVTADKLKDAISMAELREKLRNLLGQQTIIVGHSLDNDLWSLGLIHSRVIDTAHLFRLANHNTPGLRALTRLHLGESIQSGSDGHDSVEDARSTMRLLHTKLREM